MLNKLLIKFLIVTSFLVNYKVDANSYLYQEKGIRENPYLNKSKLSKQINFDELSNIIKNNNQEYKAALERFNQSTFELKATLKLRYPTIDLQSNGLPSYLISDEYRNPNYNTSTNFESKQLESSLSTLIKWDIIDPERGPEIAIKRLGVDKAKNALKMILDDLNLKAENQYYILQSSSAKVNTAKIMVNSSERSLETTITKNKALVVPGLEVIEAETQLLRDKRLLNNAFKDEAEAIRELSNTLGIKEGFYPLSNDQISIKGLWNNSLSETKKNALIYNQKLKDLNLEIKIAEKRIIKSSALTKPKFSLVNTLTGSYKLGQEEVTPPIKNEDYRRNLNNTIALTSQWRIFDAGRSKDLKKKNTSRKKEFEARYKSQNKNITKNLENFYSKLLSAKQDILNSYIQLNKQEEILNISDKRFKAGVTNQREIINNQRDLLFARNSFIDSVTFYNSNLISLKRFSGNLEITQCNKAEKQYSDFKNYNITSNIEYDPCSINFKEFNQFNAINENLNKKILSEGQGDKFEIEESKSEEVIEDKEEVIKINKLDAKQFDSRRPKEDIEIEESKAEEVIEEKEEVKSEKSIEEVIEEKEENSKVQVNEIISNVNCQNYIIENDNIYCWDGNKFNLYKN